ncbi:MAG: CRISPR-associated endoribonuclease Cas6 [Candidatus Jordarchaeum sp.]|uniref:CRISPR-associated endoribonuclease Cas6 n=1 Tax=Candidatus Jordarchaeum sp. TaxID=2823881 RepID=UPI00404A2716
MHVCFEFEGNGSGYVSLPLHYNHLVQSMIYSNISRELADFLHDKGFIHGKRTFKLFTFSRIIGKPQISNGSIVFEGSVRLYVSSPVERFIRELATTLVQRGNVTLGDTNLLATSVSFSKPPEFKEETYIRTLSPITIYSTLYNSENQKKTYYFSPKELEFSNLLCENAQKKHSILKGERAEGSIEVEPIRVKEVIVLYRGTVIKGWVGKFLLKGSKDLMRTVYETGLGNKNSQGFGMFEVIE